MDAAEITSDGSACKLSELHNDQCVIVFLSVYNLISVASSRDNISPDPPVPLCYETNDVSKYRLTIGDNTWHTTC